MAGTAGLSDAPSADCQGTSRETLDGRSDQIYCAEKNSGRCYSGLQFGERLPRRKSRQDVQ